MVSEEDARANKSAGELHEKLMTFCRGRLLSTGVYDNIVDIVKDHATRARLDGIKFPDMVVIAMPKCGGVEVVRADLDPKSIQTTIYNLALKYQTDATDIAFGIRRAFPDYKTPKHLIVMPTKLSRKIVEG